MKYAAALATHSFLYAAQHRSYVAASFHPARYCAFILGGKKKNHDQPYAYANSVKKLRVRLNCESQRINCSHFPRKYIDYVLPKYREPGKKFEQTATFSFATFAAISPLAAVCPLTNNRRVTEWNFCKIHSLSCSYNRASINVRLIACE